MVLAHLRIAAERRVVPRHAVVRRDIEAAEAGARNRRHVAGLILIAGEEEDAVAQNRTAAVEAHLLFFEGFDPVGDEVLGVAEVAVAQKPETRGAKLVRARFGHGVDHHARGTPVLGVVAVGDDLELLDVLLAVALVRSTAALAADIDTVHLISRHVAAGESGANGSRIAAGAGHERHQIQPVASVERQVLDLRRADAAGEIGLLRLDERRFPGHRDGFLQRRDLHREAERRRLADLEQQVFLDDGVEPRQLELQLVSADLERRHQKDAGRGRDRCPARAGIDMRGRHRHTRQRGTTVIHHGAADIREPCLSKRRSADRQHNADRHQRDRHQARTCMSASYLLVGPPEKARARSSDPARRRFMACGHAWQAIHHIETRAHNMLSKEAWVKRGGMSRVTS